MVMLLGLAAAVLYGTGDFLGGLATRKVPVLAVLLLAQTAGVIVALPAAALWPGPASLACGLGDQRRADRRGRRDHLYRGLAAGPMSVVAPVSARASTVLPVAVALAQGERPGTGVYAGALLCLAAVVLASCAGDDTPARSPRAAPRRRLPGAVRALGFGIASGASFGRFFLLIRNAGRSGELWPVAAARIGELAVVLVTAAVLRRSLRPRGAHGRLRRQPPPPARSTSPRTSATSRRPGPASSALPSCWPRSTPQSPCCSPGWCSASGCAGSSGQASASPRSASSSSQHERTASNTQNPARRTTQTAAPRSEPGNADNIPSTTAACVAILPIRAVTMTGLRPVRWRPIICI